VQPYSKAQKWGGRRTYPNREAKWGVSVQCILVVTSTLIQMNMPD